MVSFYKCSSGLGRPGDGGRNGNSVCSGTANCLYTRISTGQFHSHPRGEAVKTFSRRKQGRSIVLLRCFTYVSCHQPGYVTNPNSGILYNGLSRSLLKKIYPLKPRTSAEFLEMVKIHTETSILLDRRSYDEQNAPTSAVASVSMISQQQSNWKDNLDLGKMLLELQKQKKV